MESNGYWARRITRRRLLAGAGIGAAGLVGAGLVGCGGGSSSSSTPASSSASGATGQQQTSVKRGGRLAVGVGYQPSSLDAQLAANGGDSYFIDGIFNGILAYDENGAVEQARALGEILLAAADVTESRAGMWRTHANQADPRPALERALDERLARANQDDLCLDLIDRSRNDEAAE